MLIGLSLAIPQIPRKPAGASLPAFVPYTGAAIDLDFVAQRYWWGGAEKTTANFTTYVLNGSTFDGSGLTPTATIDVTLSLSGLGTFIPGAIAGAVYNASAPAAVKVFYTLDDGTASERAGLTQTATPALFFAVLDGGVVQTNTSVTGTGTLAVRHGHAASYALNDMKFSANGVGVAGDTAGTMPTVTTLRIGKSATASTNPTGSIARVVVFTAVKTQAELNALSTALRDNVVI